MKRQQENDRLGNVGKPKKKKKKVLEGVFFLFFLFFFPVMMYRAGVES